MDYIYDIHLKGLSQSGIKLLSKINWSPSKTTFYKHITTLCDDQTNILIEKMNSKNRIFWIDNFCKFMKFSKLKDTGGTKSYRWTVVGLLEHKNVEVFVRTNLNKSLYSKKPLRYLNMAEINSVFSNYKLDIDLYFMNNSIYTVPISVSKQDRVKYRFYPLKLEDVDIASNTGKIFLF